jgi:hypothetical protein
LVLALCTLVLLIWLAPRWICVTEFEDDLKRPGQIWIEGQSFGDPRTGNQRGVSLMVANPAELKNYLRRWIFTLRVRKWGDTALSTALGLRVFSVHEGRTNDICYVTGTDYVFIGGRYYARIGNAHSEIMSFAQK